MDSHLETNRELFEDDENVEYDSLCSSEDDDDELESLGNKKRKHSVDRDDYINFVNSVFNSDDYDESVERSDEEDEEEYYPANHDLNDEEAEEDDDDDDDLVRVAKHEVSDLVDGCWQTIVSDPINDNGEPKLLLDMNMSPVNPHQDMLKNAEMAIAHPSSTTTQNIDTSPYSISATAFLKNHFSNIVKRFFSDGNLSNICVDGMSIDTIRKLLARQMTMAIQLLIQMLLVCNQGSECYKEAYSKILELSNYREGALKKAALMQATVRTLTSYRKSLLRSHSNHIINNNNNNSNETTSPLRSIERYPSDQHTSLQDNQTETSMALIGQETRRLTRSQVSAQTTHRTTSIFDAPILSNINSLINGIDSCRLENRQDLESLQQQQHQQQLQLNVNYSNPNNETHQIPSFILSSSATPAVASDDMMSWARNSPRSHSAVTNSTSKSIIYPAQTLIPNNSITNSTSYHAVAIRNLQKHIEGIFEGSQHMRPWTSVIPTDSYPLPPSTDGWADPDSLTGRSFFTPAEDDLLLRGLIVIGEDWGKIRRELLPSKEEQLLEHRFSQMTTGGFSDEESKFKRYIRLEREKKTKDTKWTFADDIQLLRGYEVYGDKWALVSLFFLPHRQQKDLRNRWGTLLKDWAKMFAGSRESMKMPQLTGSMIDFLRLIHNQARKREQEEGGEGITQQSSQPSEEVASGSESHYNISEHHRMSSSRQKPSQDVVHGQMSFAYPEERHPAPQTRASFAEEQTDMTGDISVHNNENRNCDVPVADESSFYESHFDLSQFSFLNSKSSETPTKTMNTYVGNDMLSSFQSPLKNGFVQRNSSNESNNERTRKRTREQDVHEALGLESSPGISSSSSSPSKILRANVENSEFINTLKTDTEQSQLPPQTRLSDLKAAVDRTKSIISSDTFARLKTTINVDELASRIQKTGTLPLESALAFLKKHGFDDVFDTFDEAVNEEEMVEVMVDVQRHSKRNKSYHPHKDNNRNDVQFGRTGASKSDMYGDSHIDSSEVTTDDIYSKLEAFDLSNALNSNYILDVNKSNSHPMMVTEPNKAESFLTRLGLHVNNHSSTATSEVIPVSQTSRVDGDVEGIVSKNSVTGGNSNNNLLSKVPARVGKVLDIQKPTPIPINPAVSSADLAGGRQLLATGALVPSGTSKGENHRPIDLTNHSSSHAHSGTLREPGKGNSILSSSVDDPDRLLSASESRDVQIEQDDFSLGFLLESSNLNSGGSVMDFKGGNKNYEIILNEDAIDCMKQVSSFAPKGESKYNKGAAVESENNSNSSFMSISCDSIKLLVNESSHESNLFKQSERGEDNNSVQTNQNSQSSGSFSRIFEDYNQLHRRKPTSLDIVRTEPILSIGAGHDPCGDIIARDSINNNSNNKERKILSSGRDISLFASVVSGSKKKKK